MKFTVDKELFKSIPNLCFGVIIAKNIDNSKEYPEIEGLLDTEIKNITEKYADAKAKEIPEIELYREAFRKIGINPNKYMSSIEALITRTLKSRLVPHINPLVDLGNSLSLKYIIPLGIHDIDKVKGDIEIRPAVPEDRFIPFGETEAEVPDEGEIIYVSGHDVRTRRWIWRQGENGKVDETIKNAFIPLDGFTENKEAVLSLQEEFENVLKKYGVECTKGFIDKDNNVFEF